MLIQIQTRLWKWISHCASVHVSGQPRSSWAQSLWLWRCPGVPQVQDHCRPAHAQLLAMRPLSPDVTRSGVGTDLPGWHLSQVLWFKCCKKCLCSKALLKWAFPWFQYWVVPWCPEAEGDATTLAQSHCWCQLQSWQVVFYLSRVRWGFSIMSSVIIRVPIDAIIIVRIKS